LDSEGEMDRTNEEAAKWYARLHAPDCSLRDREEFDLWLNANPQHERAFRKLEGLLRAMDALGATDPRFAEIAERALTDSAADPSDGPQAITAPSKASATDES